MTSWHALRPGPGRDRDVVFEFITHDAICLKMCHCVTDRVGVFVRVQHHWRIQEFVNDTRTVQEFSPLAHD